MNMKKRSYFLGLGLIALQVIHAQDNAVNKGLKETLLDADIPMAEKLIEKDFDVNEKIDGLHPLMWVLTRAPHSQIDLIEILLKAGSQWPYTLEDSLINDDGLEIIRQETMTQYLKSQWMLKQEMSPEWSFCCKKLIPEVDKLELQYMRKESSDLSFFADVDNKNLSNVDVCCIGAAHYQLACDVKDGFVHGVKTTLALGVDPNYRSKSGMSLLSHALFRSPYYSSKDAKAIIGMLLDAGARWSSEEFMKISESEVASIDHITMTSYMLNGAELFEEIKKQEQDQETAKIFERLAKRNRKLALFLDEYELEHQLKEKTEITENILK